MQTLDYDIKRLQFYLKNDRLKDAIDMLHSFTPRYNTSILLRLSAVDRTRLLEAESGLIVS